MLYRSVATNLVAGDTLGHEDIFLFNRATATTERVSVGAGGVQGNGPAKSAAMSGNLTDGNPRYIVFTSAASNLVAGDVNGMVDVFLRDRVAATTTRISTGPGGVAANGDSFQPVVSDNGRFIAYSSSASNLVPGDTNNASDVFVLDRQTSTTERVSTGFVGEGTGSSTAPQISADGRFVAFDSSADDLVPGDDNISYDIFVRDRSNGSLERVSVGTDGVQGEGDSETPSMSRDGRFIAFDSDAEEFSSIDGNISVDVYVRDRLSHTTERASEKANGFEAFADSTGASISPDGRYVGFDTDSGDFFETADVNDDYDVYLKDMSASVRQQPDHRFTLHTRSRQTTPGHDDGCEVEFGNDPQRSGNGRHHDRSCECDGRSRRRHDHRRDDGRRRVERVPRRGSPAGDSGTASAGRIDRLEPTRGEGRRRWCDRRLDQHWRHSRDDRCRRVLRTERGRRLYPGIGTADRGHQVDGGPCGMADPATHAVRRGARGDEHQGGRSRDGSERRASGGFVGHGVVAVNGFNDAHRLCRGHAETGDTPGVRTSRQLRHESRRRSGQRKR